MNEKDYVYPKGTLHYTRALTEYNANYDESIKKAEEICSYMDDLYAIFSAAGGANVEAIKNNLQTLGEKINSIKESIVVAKNNTNARAESCNRCFTKYINKSYPEKIVDGKKYLPGADVFINGNGMICVRREYVKDKSFLEKIGDLFVPSAGEHIETYTVSKEEMFNS